MAKAQSTRPARWELVPDPFRPIFRVLTSVKFALGIIAFMALAGVIGVIVPQLPPERRAFPAARAEWFAEQRDRFGFWYEPMSRVGLFDLFSSWWFLAGLAVLVIGVAVCTFNRWQPTWRNAFRPRKLVADRYFDTARHHAEFPRTAGVEMEKALLRNGYRLTEFERPGGRYLFADKYPWVQMATFVSHLAIVMLLIGGFTSRLLAIDEFVFVAEGSTRPVFALDDPQHFQIEAVDAVGEFDADGNALDFRTDLVIYEDGAEAARGTSTVNDPMEWGGYRIHQTAYSSDGAGLRVVEAESGRVLYDETLLLDERQAAPVLTITTADDVVLSEAVLTPEILPGAAGPGRLLGIPGSETSVFLQLREEGDAWPLDIVEANPPDGRQPFNATMFPGQEMELGEMTFHYAGVSGVPASVIDGVPGVGPDGVLVQLSSHDGGAPYLAISGLGEASQAVTLEDGDGAQLGPYEYSFEGSRDFSGVTVRKDPGTNILWLGVAMLLGGLVVTFYVPRRRLWVRLTPGGIQMAGQAAHLVNVEREMRRIASEAGVVGVKLDEDEDEDET
ncbi:MAG: hypothetical protein GEU28_05455 [Dehalococcoidia bacterium]|nr:hypothetical protein [Dehalococcoidia bacterium]